MFAGMRMTNRNVAHAFSCLLDSTILVHMTEPFWASLDRYSAVRALSSLVLVHRVRAEDTTSSYDKPMFV